ncbi:serine protease [Micractinium conductrix]|uniref:Serine protease n=1 Tax=Micractinium conductrix TaxID=554055 RepID=A0A2P6V429_9CHLO|nr:serine protease [Micractinium conductrix]|eukprot:PSC68852.1 serine protease [Micractinium conductrix]
MVKLSGRSVVTGLGLYFAAAVSGYLYLRSAKAPAPSPCGCGGRHGEEEGEEGGGGAPADGQATFDRLADFYDSSINIDETFMGLKLMRRWLVRHAEGDVLEVSAGTGRNLPYYDLSTGSRLRSLTLTDTSRPMLVNAADKYAELVAKGKASSSSSSSSSSSGGGGGDASSSSAPAVRFELADAQRLVARSSSSSSSGSGSEAALATRNSSGAAPAASSSETACSGGGGSGGGGSGPAHRPPLREWRSFPPRSFDVVVDTFGLCSQSDPVTALKEMARLCKPGGRILLLQHGKGSWDFVNGILDRGAGEHHKRWGCWWNRDIERIVRQAGLRVETSSRWHFGTTYLIVARPPLDDAALSAPAPEERFSMIIVLRDAASLARLRAMCAPSTLLFRLWMRKMGLKADCQMPPAVCRRIYSETIIGFAGAFTNADLARLDRCLPGAIFYREPDGQVFKAEDGPFWRPGQQQQQQQQQQQGEEEAQKQRHGGGGAGDARRLLTDVRTMPLVKAFEERQRTPASESGPIDARAISQGVNISLPGVKRETLTPRLWNLDRLDQRELPLDGGFSYGTAATPGTGKGTTIYVVDSGIRPTHQEFRTEDGTRTRALYGFDFVEDDYEAQDCDGHGTHVAGTAIGLQVGVAKEAEVVAVRILDCTGSGTISDTVAGLDWVAANHKKPAVVTLSLGIQVGSWSRVLEDAVRALATTHGITVVVASGNSGVDACYVAPANVPEVITVAASNVATKLNGTKAGDPEDIYRWSNTGACLDLFAPGVDIFSACGGPSRCETVDDQAYSYASGTSMAVPHVAGIAAVYLAEHSGATPRDVQLQLTGTATQNKINSSRFKPGTPNRLVYSRLGDATPAAMASRQQSARPSAAWGGGSGARMASQAAAAKLRTVRDRERAGAAASCGDSRAPSAAGGWGCSGFGMAAAEEVEEVSRAPSPAASPAVTPAKTEGRPPVALEQAFSDSVAAAAAPTSLPRDALSTLASLANRLDAAARGSSTVGSSWAEAFLAGVAVGTALPARRRSMAGSALQAVLMLCTLLTLAGGAALLLLHRTEPAPAAPARFYQ